MAMVFTNYGPRGKTVNPNGTIKALHKFEKDFKEKEPKMCAGEWSFH
jgi:hypothetical protein